MDVVYRMLTTQIPWRILLAGQSYVSLKYGPYFFP